MISDKRNGRNDLKNGYSRDEKGENMRHIIALSMLAISGSAFAHLEQEIFPKKPRFSCFSAEVVVPGEGVLESIHHKGTQWVAGPKGSSYQIMLRNKCGRRVMAVVSVDGVNVVSGDSASIEQTGYVLGPYDSYAISGWRKSMSEIAEFNFTSKDDSYAGKTGRPENVGVIGVAAFYENVPVMLNAPAPMAAEMSASKRTADLGTGHGPRRKDVVEETSFIKEQNPFFQWSIRYASKEKLMSMGIMPRPKNNNAPVPFPKDRRFVPDPN